MGLLQACCHDPGGPGISAIVGIQMPAGEEDAVGGGRRAEVSPAASFLRSRMTHLGHRPSPNKMRPRPLASVFQSVNLRHYDAEPKPRETGIQAQRTASAITRSTS